MGLFFLSIIRRAMYVLDNVIKHSSIPKDIMNIINNYVKCSNYCCYNIGTIHVHSPNFYYTRFVICYNRVHKYLGLYTGYYCKKCFLKEIFDVDVLL